MDRKKIILLIIFFSGIAIMLYPTVCQYWNAKVQSQAINNYKEIIFNLDSEKYSNIFVEANNYNQKLFELSFPLIQHKKISNYFELINVNDKGMMGYITIEKLKIELPIYHGTSSSILNIAVGHLEGSSLPIGGPNTHSVLSAHRGLPSSKLFTNLDKLEIGDTFGITILDRKLTYQVDKITIVEPNEVSALAIIEGKDYITLMTCTPYGLNTHRLLVRGTRIEHEENKKTVITSNAYQINKLIVALAISLPILFILITYIVLKPTKKKPYQEEEL